MTSQTRTGSGHDWDDSRKAALFADIVSLKLSIDEAAALHGLRVDVIQEWLRQFRRSALVAFDERLKKTLIDQGANADALTAAEFTGHVEDVSIADLVQTIEIAGKDAVITVTHEGTDSRMWCSAGAIIDAESGRLSGEAAVYRILAFERGRMVADLRPEQRARTIYAATHRLLLEALRRKDECETLEKKLGNINRLYRLGERSTSSRVRVSTDELSILRLFDGPRRLRDVLAQSHIGDLESLTALVRLVDDGYLVETETGPVSVRSSTPPRSIRSTAPPGKVRGSIPPRSVHSVPRPQIKTERLDSAEQVEARRSREPAAPEEAPARAEPSVGAEPSSRHASSSAVTRPPKSRDATAREREPRSEAISRPNGADHAGSGTSFVPIAVPRTHERTTPRWVFAAVAAAVLIPAAFWFGETMSNLRASRRAHAASLNEQTERAALEAAPTFALSTRVEPASAVISLDRHPVATGHLDIMLPRDGSTHELRVAATGYIPVTLLFADVPPPRDIRLEALPVSAAAEPAPAAPPAAAAPAPPASPQPAKPAVARRTASAPTPKRRPPPPPEPSPAPPPAVDITPTTAAHIVETPPPDAPEVQVIGDGAPHVRIIE